MMNESVSTFICLKILFYFSFDFFFDPLVVQEHIVLRKQIATATAAKSLQSCPTLCDPIDGSPPGSSVPGILQARILEWGAIAFSDGI